MTCVICDQPTNLVYNQLNICKNCQSLSNELEKKYEDNISSYLSYEPPTKIIDNLYIGSKLSTIDNEKLYELGIKNINRFSNNKNVEYIELLIDDSLEQNILEFINISNEFIDRHSKSKILIYCNSGISRSSSILIGYLMSHFNWNYDTAYNFVKSKYPKAFPNSNFQNQLKQLEIFK